MFPIQPSTHHRKVIACALLSADWPLVFLFHSQLELVSMLTKMFSEPMRKLTSTSPLHPRHTLSCFASTSTIGAPQRRCELGSTPWSGASRAIWHRKHSAALIFREFDSNLDLLTCAEPSLSAEDRTHGRIDNHSVGNFHIHEYPSMYICTYTDNKSYMGFYTLRYDLM